MPRASRENPMSSIPGAGHLPHELGDGLTVGADRVEEFAATAQLAPERFAQMWNHELRDCISTLDSSPIPMAPLLLDRSVVDEVASAAQRLLALCREAVLQAGRTWKERQSALAVPDWEVPLMTDSSWELLLCSATARPDVLLSSAGPKFIELNVSASFGGPVEVHLMDRIWSDLHPSLDLGRDPMAARAELLSETVRSLGVEPRVAVIGANDEIKSAASPRYLSVEVDALRERGLDAAVVTPEHIVSRLEQATDADFPLGVRRFTNYEWNQRRISLSPVAEYARRGCQLFTSQASHLVANKAVLAWLWRAPEWMSADEVDFMRRFVPWTAQALDERCAGPDGSPVDIADFAIRERERLVLKHTTSMKGEHVYLGRELSPDAWRRRIEAAIADGRWIIQELVATTPQYLSLWHPREGRQSVSAVDVVLGPIVTGADVTGIYTRAAPVGSGVITGVSSSNMELSATAAS